MAKILVGRIPVLELELLVAKVIRKHSMDLRIGPRFWSFRATAQDRGPDSRLLSLPCAFLAEP